MPSLTMRVKVGKLDALIKAVPQVGDVVLDLASEEIVSHARTIVPVDTGFLKSTIGRIRQAPGRWKVYALAHYASYVEFGTRKMAAQPYLRPAVERINLLTLAQRAFNRLGF